MAFETLSLDDEHLLLVAILSNLLPGADISEGSFNWLWLRTLAGGAAGNDAHLAFVLDELLPLQAVDNLPAHSLLKGVIRKSATPARKASALRVVGTPATPVPAAAIFTSTSGLSFKTQNADVVGPGGYVDVDVVAIDVGSATRLSVGEVLTFSTPIAGLEETAELQLALDEAGDDIEPISAWRARIIARWQSPPRGGKQSDYVQWALEESGIADAWSYQIRAGRGTVDLAAVHDGTGDARVLDEVETADLKAKIDLKRPTTVDQFRVLQVVATPVDVEYHLAASTDSQFAWDWDDSTGGIGVSAWDPALRKLTFSTARPATMAPDDRIVVSPVSGIGGTGRERVIESLVSTNAVILEADDVADIPAVGDTVFSGGPLTQPVRQAILDLINGLGTANPGKKYGSWEGSLRPRSIERVAASIPGVTDDGATIVPGAVVEAQDLPWPDDGTIGLIVPGRVLVRRA